MWEAFAGAWFGLQAVPKFDERLGHGGWSGTRTRGAALYRDLGVQLTREGYPWRLDEPAPGTRPHAPDLDSAVSIPRAAGLGVMLMCMDTPAWAAATGPTTGDSPHAVPRGLYEPVFVNGRDDAPPGVAVNPANLWATWLTRVARRHRGQVLAYQIWNEPDFPSGDLGRAPGDPVRSWWGSVDDYARLLRVASRTIRRVDPGAAIVTGGLGYPAYLQALLDRGGGPDLDVVDFHAYGGPTSDGAVRALLDVASGFRQVLRRHGLERPLSCSESGFPARDPAEQAAALAKLYVTARTEAIGPLAWYAATNPSWRQMGLVDGWSLARPRGGFAAYRTMSRLLNQARPLEGGLRPPQVVEHRFDTPGGELRVAWAPYRRPTAAWPWRFPAGGWRVTPGGEVRPCPDGRVALASEPVLWCARRPALPGHGVGEGLPFVAGSVAVASVEASVTDPGGFHEAECAVDGDPDTEWLGKAGEGARLTCTLVRPAAVASLALKTGPRETPLVVRLNGSDGRTVGRVRLPAGGEWSLERLGLPPGPPVARMEVVWPAARQAPRLFHVELGLRDGR
jgi:hypothetical protein